MTRGIDVGSADEVGSAIAYHGRGCLARPGVEGAPVRAEWNAAASTSTVYAPISPGATTGARPSAVATSDAEVARSVARRARSGSGIFSTPCPRR